LGAFTPGQPSPRRHVNRALFNPQFVDVSTDANQAHGSQQIAVEQAAIHYPDTTACFGELGIIDLTDELAERGWSVEERRLYMADHYMAAADMVVRCALSESIYCSVVLNNWYHSQAERQRLLETLDTATSQLPKVGRWQKVEAWLRTQTFREDSR
jgi:hypothetical protein